MFHAKEFISGTDDVLILLSVNFLSLIVQDTEPIIRLDTCRHSGQCTIRIAALATHRILLAHV